jgi:hypothetical protein
LAFIGAARHAGPLNALMPVEQGTARLPGDWKGQEMRIADGHRRHDQDQAEQVSTLLAGY